MRNIDVTDEGVIRGAPRAAFDAILGLMAGRERWWSPHLKVRSVGERTPDHVGSLSEIRVPGRARFVARIEQVVAPSLLRVQYVSGDFRGAGVWSFDPEAEGTRIRFHWQVVPSRWWMRLLAPAVQRNHSSVMQLGFKALDAHLQS